MRKISWMGIGTLTLVGFIASACGGDNDDGPRDGTGGSSTGGNRNTGGNGNTGGSAMTGGDGNTGGAMGGLGGAMGGDLNDGECDDVDVNVPSAVNVKARDDMNEWGANDFDDVDLNEGLCDELIIAAEWPHESDWEQDHPADANYEPNVQFELESIFASTADLTGKQLTLTIRLLEDGRGEFADNGGYSIYLGATDTSSYNEIQTPYVDGSENMPGYSGALFNQGDETTLSLVVPSDVGDFDEDSIYKLFVRITNKYWGDGSGSDDNNPMFDYTTSVFEITNWAVTEAE